VTAALPPASPDRLTAMLRRAGVLGRGEVVDVAVETSRDTLISRITRLRLTYDGAGEARASWQASPTAWGTGCRTSAAACTSVSSPPRRACSIAIASTAT
jgi:hypothetical protein